MIKTPLLALFLTGVLLLLANLPSSSPVAEARISSPPTFENYDIRSDVSAETKETLRRLRGGELDSRPFITTRFDTELNHEVGVTEVIAANDSDEESLLARAGRRTRIETLKDFVLHQPEVFRVTDATQLVKVADYTNPDGNLSFAHFDQYVNGIPVFGAEVKAGFTKTNGMFRVINSLATEIDGTTQSKDFGTVENAVVNAASKLSIAISPTDLAPVSSGKVDQIWLSSKAFNETVTAERFYFPIGNGVLRPSWRVFLSTPASAYYVVVDSEDGRLLWRKSLTLHQATQATYNVYISATSLLRTADSPSPSPGCLAPTGCAQPSVVDRVNIPRIGNEGPYAFNNLGWIPDTGLPVRTPANPNITDGNAVEAGIDRDGTNGVDDNGWATGSPSRNFVYSYNPGPGNPPPGEEPLPAGPQPYPPTAFQQGSITQGFVTINWWHDEMYLLGFTEQARNFQHFNFSRGGVEGDRLSLEVQDSSATNTSTFTIPADGNRPRLQTFIWTGPTPDRDGTLDTQLLIHEATHGLSSRLHGNVSGLSTNMSGGMGEGWSDFYALALLSETTDPLLFTYPIGGYATYLATPGFMSNYYYGLRRFPYALRASLGPNGRPHNPLTFRYINAGCNTLIGTDTTNPNSAYPRSPFPGSPNCDQVHNIGEVWASLLWEVRAQLIDRHGPTTGTRRALQYVTDGMKLAPLNPTMIQERDAIMAAASFSDATDLAPVRRGFAIRGMGSSASVTNVGTGNNNTVVVEAFDLPQQDRRPPRADFDGDGKSDLSVFRPSDRNWYIDRSFSGFLAVNWGISTDKPIADDYDGDGKADITVYRATADSSMPDYYTLLSATSTISFLSWGTVGDIPFAEDFDADNKADYVVYRPSTTEFWVRRSTDGAAFVGFGVSGRTPIVGDFDGDGRGDFASFANGSWTVRGSDRTYAIYLNSVLGQAGDKPVPADYDGDGKDDLAVYRPSNGTWYIRGSAVGSFEVNFGLSADIPVPGDYDGDGRADIAVYRDGTWFIYRSTGGVLITGFGLAGDIPIPSTYIP